METIRCFLGVKLDYDTARALADVQRALKKRFDDAGARISWVPPPNMHVTIRFLGQVTEPLTYALKGILKPVTGKIPSFSMDAAGLGAFPSMEEPRVIWAGVELGKEELNALFKNVSERLVETGFHLDDKKPYSAHITLGRVKEGNGEPLKTFIEEEKELEFGSTFIRNLYCYRSDFHTHGAEYHVMWRLPLARAVAPESPKKNYYQEREPEPRPQEGTPNDNE